MRTSPLLSSIALSLVLAACGGDSNTQSSLPEPTPAPVVQPVTISLRNVIHASDRITNLAYGNGKYVVSAYGGVITSIDGQAWSLHAMFTDEQLKKVEFGNGRFVAISDKASTFTSANGLDWTSQKSSSLAQGVDLVYANGIFVAVVNDGILSSQDGSTWTRRVSAQGFEQAKVGYNGRFFILKGNSIFSSHDGISWQEQASPAVTNDRDPASITYGNGQYVLLVNYLNNIYPLPDKRPGTYIYTSPDGLTWNLQFDSGTEFFKKITFVNGRFLALGTKGEIRMSTDGLNWETRNSGTTSSLESAAYANGRYVISGGGMPPTIISSTDGITWTTEPTGINEFHQNFNVTRIGDHFFVMGSGAVDRIGTSKDGQNWTFQATNLATDRGLRDVIFSNGQFTAVSNMSSPVSNQYQYAKVNVLSSTDGVTWTIRRSGNDVSLNSVATGEGKYVAVGDRVSVMGEGSVATSEDGINWVKRTTGITKPFTKVIYGAGQFLAITQDLVPMLGRTDGTNQYVSSIVGSIDGVNWTTRVPESPGSIYGIAYGNGKFIAVGSDATSSKFIVSSDGQNWTTVPSNDSLGDIAFARGQFAVNSSNTIRTSIDGVTWAQQAIKDTGGIWIGNMAATNDTFLAFPVDILNYSGGFLASSNGIDWTFNQQAGGVRAAAFGNSKWVMLMRESGILVSP